MSATDPRTDAARDGIYEAWVVAAHPAMRTLERREEWAEQAGVLATVALAAADAVDTRVQQLTEAAIAHVRSHYDESIFPPRQPGPHSEVYDGEAAAVARLTCDNILREFRERLAEVDASQEPAAVSGEPGDVT